MRATEHLVAALVIALSASACDGADSTLPTTPSLTPTAGEPVTPMPAPPRGTIAVVSVAPSSGATLVFRNCQPADLALSDVCTNDWSITADVEIDRSVEAILVATFYAGASRCGYATSSWASFEPNKRASLSISYITVSDEEHESICGLPVTITRLSLQLYERGNPRTALLADELASSYTFAKP
jgi:hypothetical protein